MMTPTEAIAAWTARGFAVRHSEQAGGWLVFTSKDQRVQIPPQPDPVSAIEAADLHLAQREAEVARRDLGRLAAEMQRGRYFHRSRLIQEADGEGGTTDVALFDIIRANGAGTGSVTSITSRRSVVVAWRDLVEALQKGETP